MITVHFCSQISQRCFYCRIDLHCEQKCQIITKIITVVRDNIVTSNQTIFISLYKALERINKITFSLKGTGNVRFGVCRGPPCENLRASSFWRAAVRRNSSGFRNSVQTEQHQCDGGRALKNDNYSWKQKQVWCLLSFKTLKFKWPVERNYSNI